MEELITRIMEQSPIAGSVIAVVVMFLRHLNKREEALERVLKEQHLAFRQDLADRDTFVTNLGEECHNVQRQTVEAVKENTRQLSRVEAVLERCIKETMAQGRNGNA